MTQPLIVLLHRYGEETRSPTLAQLAQAVAELYHEALPGMRAGDYAEHGAASLRYGYDGGPMYVLEITRLQEVIFEEWADQDYERELVPPRKMRVVPEEMALQLWTWLTEGAVDRVHSQPWV
jgi:hypothetical protein